MESRFPQSGVTMGAPAAAASPGRRRLAAAALLAIAALCLLYLLFMFQLYNDAGLRDLGFTGQTEISRYSFLAFALLVLVMLGVRMWWVPSAAHAAAAASGAPATGSAGGVPAPAVIPSTGGARRRVSAEDPASRPGAPPSTSVPLIKAEDLKGGWKRWRFPAERTGGLYVDTDIVVDDGSTFADSADAKRGRFILRVRDEVARVCVRCDLIDHCHGKVATLITREEMRANHDCVPGLKQIAAVKIEGLKRAQREEAAAAAERAAATQSASPSPDSPAPQPAESPAPTAEAPTVFGAAAPVTEVRAGPDSGPDSN